MRATSLSRTMLTAGVAGPLRGAGTDTRGLSVVAFLGGCLEVEPMGTVVSAAPAMVPPPGLLAPPPVEPPPETLAPPTVVPPGTMDGINSGVIMLSSPPPFMAEASADRAVVVIGWLGPTLTTM